MKTLKIFLGFFFLITLGFISSCVKLDRPAELSIDAQILEFDNSILNRQFNVMNMGDDPLFIEAFSDKSWVSVTYSLVELSHAQTSIINVQINTDLFQEYGVYTATLFVQSNGGNLSIPIEVYYYQPAEPVLALDMDYIKFPSNTSQDEFTIYNDGVEDLNFLLQTEDSWIQLSQEIGTIIPNGEQRIYVDVDRSGLAAGMYSTEVNITSSGGNAVLNVDMDVSVYSITFFNPVYTAIEILSTEFNPVVIEAGDRHSFVYADNPLSFTYTASTTGSTDDGNPLGVEIIWDETIDVSTYNSPTFNLNVSADYFFMAVRNTGNYGLDMWSINWDNDFQIDDDFYIPNDGVEYGVAYYDAFDDTHIYARLSGTLDDVEWEQGIHFVFPWIENQYILLENNFKKTLAVRPDLKSRSNMQLQVKPFNKSTQKSKGSIDLYNKK